MDYEGERFKVEDSEYYSVSGKVPSFEYKDKPAWCILDEEDGGYVAFCTDQKSANFIVDTLNAGIKS